MKRWDTYPGGVGRNSFLGHIGFRIIFDSFGCEGNTLHLSLILLNIGDMCLQIGEDTQLLGRVFALPSAQDHAQ